MRPSNRTTTTTKKQLLIAGDAIAVRQKRDAEEDAIIKEELDQLEFPSFEQPPVELSLQKTLFGEVFGFVSNEDYIIFDLTPKTEKAKKEQKLRKAEGLIEERPNIFLHSHCTNNAKLPRKEMALFTRKHRIISLDLSNSPHLADEHEWFGYINQRFPNCIQCTCTLKDYIGTSKEAQIFPVSLPPNYDHYYIYNLGETIQKYIKNSGTHI